MATSGPLLLLDELRVWFPTSRGVVRAVDGASLSLEHGRTLGIVGESGSGKSVTARAIMGLVNGNVAPAPGRVVFDGRDLGVLPQKELRRLRGVALAIVFQDPMTALNPTVTIGRQVRESLQHHLGVGRREAQARAIDLLAQVGIPQPRRRVREYPHQLSGGMRQRVVIAAALACDPKLLIADEPTTALDVTVQRQILDLLSRLTAERGMATILITHDLAIVAGRTDETAVMYAGRIVEHGPTRTVFRGMRHPYTAALMGSIPPIDRAERLTGIPGRPPDPTALPTGCAFAPRCKSARPACRESVPPLTPQGVDGHEAACFFPLASAVAPASLDRGAIATMARTHAR